MYACTWGFFRRLSGYFRGTESTRGHDGVLLPLLIRLLLAMVAWRGGARPIPTRVVRDRTAGGVARKGYGTSAWRIYTLVWIFQRKGQVPRRRDLRRDGSWVDYGSESA